MFNSMVLEVALGLFFIYFLVASLCSAIQEFIAGWAGWRAKTLKRALVGMIGPDAAELFYGHALVPSLPDNGSGKAAKANVAPAKKTEPRLQHLDPSAFAHALLDMHLSGALKAQTNAANAGNRASNQKISKAIDAIGASKMPSAGDVSARLRSGNATQAEIQSLVGGLEQWYEAVMEQASGEYKKYAQLVILVVAALVSGLLNIDTIAIGNMLATNSTVRQSIVQLADKQVQQGDAPTSKGSLTKVTTEVKNLEALQIPLGWPWKGDFSSDRSVWASKLGGVLLTIFAATMGAPFWFDLLNKVVNVRNSGRKPKSV